MSVNTLLCDTLALADFWQGTEIRKILVSAKLFVRNSGAGNGCTNFMGAWKKCVLSAGKPLSIEFLLLGGGFGGGGGADFIFMGARIFLTEIWEVDF